MDPRPSEYPRITIVTPSFNQGPYIERTIRSVLNQGYPNLEYIVIDGGSRDDTVDILRKYERQLSHWVSEPDNGQSQAINKGLARATGEIFNWLNSDDALTSGALFKVAEAWRESPDAAAWVGACQRITPDGQKLNAIFPNGLTLSNMGENWNGRQFYQPSCFMNTSLVRQLGGVDETLEFCMDLHLWLRLAARRPFVAGHGIWSNALIHPEAKTQARRKEMHLETAQVSASLGFERGAAARKQYALHRTPRKFIIPDELREALDELGSPNTTSKLDLHGRHLTVVSNFLPRHDASSSNLRVFSLLRLIMDAGARVTYLYFHTTRNDERYLQDLGAHCRLLPEEAQAIAEAVEQSEAQMVWLTNLWTPGLLRLHTDIMRRLRQRLPTTPVILDTMDLHSRKYETKYALSQHPKDLALAEEFLDLEQQAYSEADSVIAVSHAERQAILETIPDSAPVTVVPNVHRLAPEPTSRFERSGLVFLGNFHVNHNEDAARHFVSHILPLIHEQRPKTGITFLGRGADTVLANLASDNVIPMGFVQDLEHELARYLVFVCPLTYGTGLKGKIGISAGAGVPIVTTTIGAEGYDFADGRECFIADEPLEFALKTVHLLDDATAWNNFSLRARAAMAKTVGPQVAAQNLARLFADLLAAPENNRTVAKETDPND